MARHVCEWATRGGERRNTAAYDKGISLGVCRTILGISVNDAGSIFWCARARRLVYSAAQRARRAASSLAQWQRPRMWIYVAAPHRTTKPSRGCLRVVVRKPRLVLAEFRATWNKVTATHPCDVRGRERPLCSAWTRRVRFPGVRALGGSSARRLGGLSGPSAHRPSGRGPGSGFAPKRAIGPRN